MAELLIQTMEGDIKALEEKQKRIKKGEKALSQPVERVEEFRKKQLIEKDKAKRERLSKEKRVQEKRLAEQKKRREKQLEKEKNLLRERFEKLAKKRKKIPLIKPVIPKTKPISSFNWGKEIKARSELNWARVVSTGLALFIIIGGLGGFTYWFFYLKNFPQTIQEEAVSPEPEPAPEPEPELIEPTSLLLEAEKIILFLEPEDDLLAKINEYLTSQNNLPLINRILAYESPSKETLGLNSLFQKLNLSFPETFGNYFKEHYEFLLLGPRDTPRLGLIIEIEGKESVWNEMQNWETTMVDDLKNLMLFTPVRLEEKVFQASEILEPPLHRYINLDNPSSSLDYVVLEKKLLVITSKEKTFLVIDKLAPDVVETK